MIQPIRWLSSLVRGASLARSSGPRKEPSPGNGYSNADGRGWLNHILLHHYAESLAIDRAAQAKGYGMSSGDVVSRFAGNSTTTVNNTGGGFVRGALTAALVAGLAAGGVSLWPLLVGSLRNTEKQVEAFPEEIEIDLEVRDGKIVPTEVRRVD
ncbi:MAG: hypothetical protein NNA30_11495 [Nitrospira sp.]|nr:hypothetical protein [Nitrospira sp.]